MGHCKYCNSWTENNESIFIGYVREDNDPEKPVTSGVIELTKDSFGKSRIAVTVHTAGKELPLIDWKIPVNFCPICGRELKRE